MEPYVIDTNSDDYKNLETGSGSVLGDVGDTVVQGLKNIGKRIKTTVRDIQKDLGEDAITKDEAIVSGAVLGAYPIHKMQQKKEEKKSIMELETNASQKAKNNN